jgi:hypothetical protein
MHQTGRNTIIAKKLITPFLPAPPMSWSSSTICMNLGHGVWYITGDVQVAPIEGLSTPTPWGVIFVPATAEPLYLAFGSRRAGDMDAALRRAGVQLHPH